MIGAVASQTGDGTMATVLSVESQAKALFAAILAPLLGLAVDAVGLQWRFAPVALLGVLVACWGIISSRRSGT